MFLCFCFVERERRLLLFKDGGVEFLKVKVMVEMKVVADKST